MNKKVLLGCGLAVFLVLVAFAVVLVMFGTKVVNFASEIINESQDRSSWIAPADGTSGEALFPATVGEANRRSIEKVADLAALSIRQDGEHGSYQMGNGAAVEVYAWRVAQSEVDAFFTSVGKAIDDGPYNLRTKVTVNRTSMRFRFSPPDTSGRLWFNKGWMFLFLTRDDIELEPLEDAYIKAVGGVDTGSSDQLLEVEATQ
ncbi:MAG: hypothetical protein R3F19_26345 [Verrucomicrobiales bacterium]